MPTTEEEVPQKSIPLALQSLFYKVCGADDFTQRKCRMCVLISLETF